MSMSEEIKQKVISALKEVYDPEIPVNIVDLGLIYNIDIRDNNKVHIKMTLTAPGCPVYALLQREIEEKVRAIEGIRDVKVEFVWDPPWTPKRMTKEGREIFKSIFGYDIVEEYEKMYGR